MNQQPDKFFRDKLQSFQTPAPSGAWNRIEANLDKKKNKLLWLRIAATLLLLAVATYLLMPLGSGITPGEKLAKSSKPTLQSPAGLTKKNTNDSTTANQALAKKEKNLSNTHFPINKKAGSLKKKRQQEMKVTKDLKDQRPLAQTSEEKQSILNIEETEPALLPTGSDQPVAVVPAEEKKIKIIFSAEEVDNKYLNKNAVAQATSEEKKPSTLKKIFDKAYDLKYNQDPFGDLRDKKNEILALNFKTDKQRSDKK